MDSGKNALANSHSQEQEQIRNEEVAAMAGFKFPELSGLSTSEKAALSTITTTDDFAEEISSNMEVNSRELRRAILRLEEVPSYSERVELERFDVPENPVLETNRRLGKILEQQSATVKSQNEEVNLLKALSVSQLDGQRIAARSLAVSYIAAFAAIGALVLALITLIL